MAYITVQEARTAFRQSAGGQRSVRSAKRSLGESTADLRPGETFDVFLSHSFRDAEAIAGLKEILEEEAGLTVYVDWVEDGGDLDRAKVTATTASWLRARMRASASLFYVTSEASPASRWMPWELGYFDGFRDGRVAVLPLVAQSSDAFTGQEYLGLYPTVERLRHTDGGSGIYVTSGPGTHMSLVDFKAGRSTFETH